jgi:hypothetical protein
MMSVKPEKMNAAETVTASWLRFQGSLGSRFGKCRGEVTRTDEQTVKSASARKEI